MISENDVFFNQPDSNTDALHHLLTSLAGSTSEEVDTILTVHHQARTLKASSIDIIFKDKSALQIFALPYTFHGLRATKLFLPSLVHQWQQCATPIAGPYMTLMAHVLYWLASPLKIDLTAVNTIDLVHEQMSYSPEDLGSILNTSFFDHKFFQILEDGYMKYLKPAMITFGQEVKGNEFDPSETIVPDDLDDEAAPKAKATHEQEFQWGKAFAKYISWILKEVTGWIEGKMKFVDDMATRLMLDMLVPKIKFLSANNMLGNYKKLPTVNAPVPLLSILFYNDFSKSLADVSDAITMVGSDNSSFSN